MWGASAAWGPALGCPPPWGPSGRQSPPLPQHSVPGLYAEWPTEGQGGRPRRSPAASAAVTHAQSPALRPYTPASVLRAAGSGLSKEGEGQWGEGQGARGGTWPGLQDKARALPHCRGASQRQVSWRCGSEQGSLTPSGVRRRRREASYSGPLLAAHLTYSTEKKEDFLLTRQRASQ